MKTKRLTPRLACAAALVPQGARLADVGTDHAYLPIALCLEGRIPTAIAGDVREGPLARARENINAYGLGDRIRAILSDGFTALPEASFDAAVIAGMGGETIADILARAPFLQHERYALILQPQSRAEVLRAWLLRAGFSIEIERFACEGEKLYTVLRTRYTGERRAPAAAECYLSRALRQQRPDGYAEYLERLERRILRERDGLLAGAELQQERMRLLGQLLQEIRLEQEEGK